MNWIESDYMDPDLGRIGHSRLPDTPGGWWVLGGRDDEVQSRVRPCTLMLIAATDKKPGGVAMFYDSGEAFSYFERGKKPALPQMPSLNMSMLGGMFGFALPTMPEIPVPEVPLPNMGRPLRYFSSIGDYLDDCALKYMNVKGDLRVISEEVIGNMDEVVDRERRRAKRREASFSTIEGPWSYIVNKMLDRVVVRMYEFIGPDGKHWRVVLGAKFAGHDVLVYNQASDRPQKRPDVPFGRCVVGNALLYDVEWMAEYRFGGCCPMDHKWSEGLLPWCKSFSNTASFDNKQIEYMTNLEKRLSDEAHEKHKRDIEGLRRLNEEMHQENRRRQERLDWERARSWERKQASDRRIREGWSAAIRGVEQYRGPYGELIEVPVSGPGYHAYYDRLSGTVLHTDRYMGGAWEELPEWRW